jgi:hypothetical protein
MGQPAAGLPPHLAALSQHYHNHHHVQQAPGTPSVTNNNPSMNPVPAMSAPGAQVNGVGMPGAYISGPPTFLHVNGITYKPVEEPSVASQPAAVVKPAVEAAETAAPAVPANAKMLTERDLHRAIDQRVQSRVESYLSTRRQPSYASHTSPSHSGGGGVRSAHHTAAGKSHAGKASGMTAEERAAQRVQSVNATMRARSSSDRDDEGHGLFLRDW